MAGYPPPYPPPGFDPRAQRRFLRDQARAQARAQRDAFRAQREQVRYQMRNMGRGSILGPLLLIAAGVVFLLIQTGRIDHSRFWGWYGRWWRWTSSCCAIRSGRPIGALWAAGWSSL